MENVIKKLKDSLGNLVYPITKTKAVYDDSNNRLDNTLSTINSDLTTAKQNIDTHTSQIAALNSSLEISNPIEGWTIGFFARGMGLVTIIPKSKTTQTFTNNSTDKIYTTEGWKEIEYSSYNNYPTFFVVFYKHTDFLDDNLDIGKVFLLKTHYTISN